MLCTQACSTCLSWDVNITAKCDGHMYMYWPHVQTHALPYAVVLVHRSRVYIQVLPIYCCSVSQKPTDEPFWKDVVPLFQQLSQKELQMFPGRNWEHGWKYTTLICDSQLYMRYLNQQFDKVCAFSLMLDPCLTPCVCCILKSKLDPGTCVLSLSVSLHFLQAASVVKPVHCHTPRSTVLNSIFRQDVIELLAYDVKCTQFRVHSELHM